MTAERWRRVGEIFHEALEVEREQRANWVAAACAGDAELQREVESLLANDDEAAGGFLEAGMAPVVQSLLRKPERAGVYRLVGELGRGGMGTVYLAERDDAEYQARVAVKLVRRGMDTEVVLNRFFRERQTLARLQHPNIARLLDGGTTADGIPYLVMEYVQGARITDYCREKGLGIRARLELFLKVGAAVEYAHRNFVVHRDLKPGNILVDESGEVKLLDFGICKLLHNGEASGEETMAGDFPILTPEYASPEQVRGEPVTVASDIYSAGAVLYELLSGVKPHQVKEQTLRGLQEAICERVPPRMSEVAAEPARVKALRGDLDTIVQTAMQKEPGRRYGSMELFTRDVRRHLAHEPIEARPDSLGYRLGKFLRRRRGWVASAAAVGIAVALGTWSSIRSARIAEENLRIARQLANSFVIDVHDLVRDLPGATRAKDQIVTTGLKYLENLAKNAGDDAELKAELAAAYERIGDVQGNVMGANLGKTKEARASFEKALALLEEVEKTKGRDGKVVATKVRLHRRIAGIYEYERNPKAMRDSYGRARRMAEELVRSRPGDDQAQGALVDILVAAATTARSERRIADARADYLSALPWLEQQEAKHPDHLVTQATLVTVYSGLGICDSGEGRLREAREWHLRGIAQAEKVVRLSPDNVVYRRQLMFAYSHLGDVSGSPNLSNLGDAAGAYEAYGKMAGIAKGIFEADRVDQRARSDYGIALMRMALVTKDVEEKIRRLRESAELQEEVVRVNPANAAAFADLAVARLFLGDALLEAGRAREAIGAYRESLRISEPRVGTGTPALLTAVMKGLQGLGVQLGQRGEREEALRLARRALEIGDPEGAAAKRRPESLRKFVRPRSLLTAGLIEAAAGDRMSARQHLAAAADLYAGLVGDPGYTKLLARELESMKKVLGGLK